MIVCGSRGRVLSSVVLVGSPVILVLILCVGVCAVSRSLCLASGLVLAVVGDAWFEQVVLCPRSVVCLWSLVSCLVGFWWFARSVLF